MKYRVFAWPRQVDLYGKYKPEQYNPQYWDEKKGQWRPFTVKEGGIIKPKLYDSRLEARQFIKIMEMKEKK